MSKVKVKVKEMVDATVSFISLVNRPANRIPFRVTKAEEIKEESDMMKLLRRKQDGQESQAAAPALAGIVVAKGDVEAYAPVLADAGYSVEDRLEIDDVIVLKQYDFNEGEVSGVKLSNGLSVLVGNMPAKVEKAYDEWAAVTSVDYNEVHSAERFIPGLMLSLQSLQTTLANVLDGPFDKGETSTAVSAALTAFSTSVMSLVDSLPPSVFQLDMMDFVMMSETTEEVNTCSLEDVAKAEEVEVVQEEVVEEVEEEVVEENLGEEVSEEVVEEAEEVVKEEEEVEEVTTEEVEAVEAGDVDAAGYVIKDEDEAAIAAEIAAQVAEQEVVEVVEKLEEVNKEEVVAEEVVEKEVIVQEEVVMCDNSSHDVPEWAKLLISKFDSLEATLAEVQKSNEELSGRVETVETVAKTADTRLAKAVLGTSMPDAVKAKKAEPKKDIWAGLNTF